MQSISLPRLLIAIPTKTDPEYLDRQASCEATWLRNSPVDYKFFRDADWQLDPNDPKVRQKRMKVMCQYALRNGYDFIFRVDSDAYVWPNRLLTCGFEGQDYVGYCLPYPLHLAEHCTAHAGVGFFLSRKAMDVIVAADHFAMGDKIYWGDIWTGETLFKYGIRLHRETRFLDGQGREDVTADLIPLTHPYAAIHPVSIATQKALYERGAVSDEVIAPEKPLFEPDHKYNYGRKDRNCPCDHCNG